MGLQYFQKVTEIRCAEFYNNNNKNADVSANHIVNLANLQRQKLCKLFMFNNLQNDNYFMLF